MRLIAEFFYHLRPKVAERFRDGPVSLEVAEPFTVADLLALAGLPPQTPKIVLADGRAAAPDTLLREGQHVVVFPPLEGG